MQQGRFQLRENYSGNGTFKTIADALNQIGHLINNMHYLGNGEVVLTQDHIRLIPHHLYMGPFHVTVEDDGDNRRHIIKVNQGYIFAGKEAEYSWPGSSPADTDTINTSGLGSGTYQLVMDVVVNPDRGYFSESYRPHLHTPIQASSSYPLLQDSEEAQIILANFTLNDDDEVIYLYQRWHGDIYVPVFEKQDHSGDAYHIASWHSWDTPAASHRAITIPNQNHTHNENDNAPNPTGVPNGTTNYLLWEIDDLPTDIDAAASAEAEEQGG